MKKISILLILFISIFSSCKDDVDPFGPITLEFDNRLEDHQGATITYDITDIKIKREDDGLIQHDSQVHHVDASNEASQEITLQNVTSGGYTEVTFSVESIKVTGPVTFDSDSTSVTLQMPRTPVRAGHEPEVHIIFDITKLSTSVQAAFVVDHIHEN